MFSSKCSVQVFNLFIPVPHVFPTPPTAICVSNYNVLISTLDETAEMICFCQHSNNRVNHVLCPSCECAPCVNTFEKDETFVNNLDKHARDKVLHACAVFRPLFLCGMCFVLQSRRKDKTFVDNLRKHGWDQVVHVFRPLIGCGMCCPTLPSSWCLLIMRPKAGETRFGRELGSQDIQLLHI